VTSSRLIVFNRIAARRVPFRHNVRVSLDREIDDLFQKPLAEFTRARNALVKTVRGADATRVRTLEKPTVVAWAVNQVYWRARPIFDRLMKAGERLRKAQIAALAGKSTDLREANDAHRKALAEAVREAERIASDAGSHPSPDALMRTFEALSLAKDPPERPGQLSDALQPAGFEALAGVTPKVRPKADATRSTKAGPARGVPLQPDHRGVPRQPDDRGVRLQPDQPSPAELRKRAAEEKKHAADERKRAARIKKAEAALERAKAKMRAAEDALRRTQER
jgi:hypothetical protein